MLKHSKPFKAQPTEQEDAKYQARALHDLQRKAQKLGARLVLETTSGTDLYLNFLGLFLQRRSRQILVCFCFQ
jgi:hypothetical protein